MNKNWLRRANGPLPNSHYMSLISLVRLGIIVSQSKLFWQHKACESLHTLHQFFVVCLFFKERFEVIVRELSLVCRDFVILKCNDTSLLCPFRHEKYRTQYRAMFVMNCTVKREEVLRYKNQQEKNRRNRKRRRGQQTETPADETPAAMGMDADEVYHPVQCSECSTEVAVFDKDEVYHFFNILASHCWQGLNEVWAGLCL